ncbi:MAG: glycosyltransferase family 87 protein [Promethearchaeota archaeon]
MNLKTKLRRIYDRFLELLEFNIFKLAVVIHLIYFTISLIIFFMGGEVDFIVYYQAGNNFTSDILNLYTFPYLFPYRYLPLSALLFVPFAFLDYQISFVLFNVINLILNILICVMIYKLASLFLEEKDKSTEKRLVFLISIYLIGFPQLSTYVLGQINLYVSLLLLTSLYIYLKYNSMKMQLFGSILLGISIIIKPITICMIPFLILIHFDLKSKKFTVEWKKTIIRLVGSLIPLMLNLIVFYLYPSLWEGFLNTNLTSEYTITANPSFSITKLITNFLLLYDFPFEQIIVFLGVLLVIGGISILTLILKKPGRDLMVFGYLLGIIVMLLSYFDSWDHHIVVLTPLLIIMIMNFPENSKLTRKYLKPGFLVVSFLNLIGFGVWILTQAFFPYNFVSTVFLLLVLFGMVKHVVSENLSSEEIERERGV